MFFAGPGPALAGGVSKTFIPLQLSRGDLIHKKRRSRGTRITGKSVTRFRIFCSAPDSALVSSERGRLEEEDPEATQLFEVRIFFRDPVDGSQSFRSWTLRLFYYEKFVYLHGMLRCFWLKCCHPNYISWGIKPFIDGSLMLSISCDQKPSLR